MSGYKVLGTTDDVTTCHCCGRDDLRMTVAIDTTDIDGNADGDTGYYGTHCAARMMGTTAKRVTDRAAVGNREQREAEEVARIRLDRYDDVEGFFPRDAVLRFVEANWRHTSGMFYEEILEEVRGMVADARAVLGLAKPAPDDVTRWTNPAPVQDSTTDQTEEAPVADALFSEYECTQLKGQSDIFDQVEDALTETAPAPVVEEADLPGDGTLFALRVTDTPDPEAGALFGLGI